MASVKGISTITFEHRIDFLPPFIPNTSPTKDNVIFHTVNIKPARMKLLQNGK